MITEAEALILIKIQYGIIKSAYSSFGCCLFCSILLLLFSACNTSNHEIAKNSVSVTNFAGSKACLSCHSAQYSSWMGSHHQQTMKIADPTNVLGNFNKITFTGRSFKSTYFKKGGNYYVYTFQTILQYD